MTITKTAGVVYADYRTCLRIQELIVGYMRQCPVGKVSIDAEKITFYKFGLKLGIARFSVNGIIYSNGCIMYAGMEEPEIEDRDICNMLFELFGRPRM